MKKFSTITLGMVMLLTVSCSNDMIEVTDTATMNNGSNDIVAQMSHFNDSLSMTKPETRGAGRILYGSSGKWSDNVSIEQKKTAEHFVYLNNHKQIYKNEQQFSISCMGALQS